MVSGVGGNLGEGARDLVAVEYKLVLVRALIRAPLMEDKIVLVKETRQDLVTISLAQVNCKISASALSWPSNGIASDTSDSYSILEFTILEIARVCV